VLEFHTTTRFAWLRKNSAEYTPQKQGFTNPIALMRFAWNAAFWVFLIPFFTPMAYGTAFIAFGLVILARFIANLVTNNVLDLTPEQHERYPLRIP
jgi:hypothetical protein